MKELPLDPSQTVPKRRGRPPKSTVVEAPVESQGLTISAALTFLGVGENVPDETPHEGLNISDDANKFSGGDQEDLGAPQDNQGFAVTQLPIPL